MQSSGYNTSTMLKNDYLPEDRLVDIDLSIHSGDETTDKISLNYECLRLKTIGLADTNVLTQNSALDAIDEIAGAVCCTAVFFCGAQKRISSADS